MNHTLYINGTSAGHNHMPGCSCRRCNDFSLRRANTSVSLITYGEQQTPINHILIDAGAGVADSIAQNPCLKHPYARLDQILLTHWHRDHTLDLNRILIANFVWKNHLHRDVLDRVPLWCRTGSSRWLHDLYEFEINQYLSVTESGESNQAGTLLDPISHRLENSIQIRPLTLSHFSADFDLDRTTYLPSCCGYLIETDRAKTILMWDIDNQNNWLVNPQHEAHDETVRALMGADLLLIATSWWRKQIRKTGHTSFETATEMARVIQPKQTGLMHISGHADGPENGAWGWSDEEWTENACRHWRMKGIPGDVFVPAIGQTFMI